MGETGGTAGYPTAVAVATAACPPEKPLPEVLEQQLRAGTPESELKTEFLELLDEMDNVTRER